MNEPAINDRPFGDAGERFGLNAPQGRWGSNDRLHDHAEVHNLYGLKMARELRRAGAALPRSVLTRQASQVQRWSSVWMGDNQSLWDHLMSLPMLCNIRRSICRLRCRWFRWQRHCGIIRALDPSGDTLPTHAWSPAMTTARHALFLAIANHLPRIYRVATATLYLTLFREAASGAPILRPLPYHFPNDSSTYTLYDQVLLGPSPWATDLSTWN